ncbi:uncharacterized protein LOC117169324 [Belonocnema kinseyi]|uniref:uncharacterized protein LOC117169324 n=1 Tax=Belonocnema kinseyi TaxID=2817044 RepID=UPI00143D908D|nr:uncharacterized protein LOC117169324 [Belonocnema kinseyi]
MANIFYLSAIRRHFRTDIESRSVNSAVTMPGYKWVRYSGARCIVPKMITVGRDLDGSNLVIGRATHHGDLLPAKVKPEHGVAYVSYGGQEHAKHDFEILMPACIHWVPSRNGIVPHGSVEVGSTSTGETLYVGRVLHNGVMTSGKIQPSHHCLYIPYDGHEISYKDYEILVQN